MKGDVHLTIQNEIKYQGQYAAEFGSLHYDAKKSFSTFISNTTPVTISFCYFKNSLYSMNVKFLIDDNFIDSLSSTNWIEYTYTLNSGNHILTWSISNCSSWVPNIDFAWIDNIVIQ